MSTSSWFFFRTEVNWKLCVRTCATDSDSDTERPGLKPVCQHSNTKHQAFVRFFRKQRHKSMCKFSAIIILFFRVFISAPLRVTRLLRAGRCLVAYVLRNSESSFQTLSYRFLWSSPPEVQLSPQSACICVEVISHFSIKATWSSHRFLLAPVQT